LDGHITSSPNQIATKSSVQAPPVAWLTLSEKAVLVYLLVATVRHTGAESADTLLQRATAALEPSVTKEDAHSSTKVRAVLQRGRQLTPWDEGCFGGIDGD